MVQLVWMTTIVNRNKGERFATFFQKRQVPVTMLAYGVGTATNDTLDYLGIDHTEKQIFFSLVEQEQAKSLLRDMQREMRLYIPGNGIAYTVALQAFAGSRALGLWDMSEGEKVMEKTKHQGETDMRTPLAAASPQQTAEDSQYELIVVILNRGYVEKVMDAARKAFARGGTVIHALGTGSARAEEFFGISIAKEKDMIFIVATHKSRNDIIKAIVAEAGVQTKCHAIAFSLPVSDVAGIRLEED